MGIDALNHSGKWGHLPGQERRIENSGTQNNYWIGNDIKTKEELLEKIGQDLKQIQVNNKATQQKIDSILNSPMWQQIKKP